MIHFLYTILSPGMKLLTSVPKRRRDLSRHQSRWWKVAAAVACVVISAAAATVLLEHFDRAVVVTKKNASVLETDVKAQIVPVEKEADNMKSINAAAVVSAAAILMGIETASAFSEPVQINFAPSLNRQWSTICTNDVLLQWEWPTEATTAQLEISGMNQSALIDFTEVTSNYLWQAFSGSVPSAEDIYNLSLTFYAGGEDLNQTLNSKLAVVKGAFEAAVVDFGPSEKKWSKVRDNVVIPYDAGWTETTAGAVSSMLAISKRGGLLQSNSVADASGWYDWNLKNGQWGYGTFDLALSFPGFEDEWTATLVRTVDGTILTIR